MSDLSILSFAEPEILYDEPEPAPELSVVMPCLNEAETLADCIDLIQQTVHAHHIDAEIIVADNGSTDGSHDIAMLRGARVVHVADARLRRSSPRRHRRRPRPIRHHGRRRRQLRLRRIPKRSSMNCAQAPTWSWATASAAGSSPVPCRRCTAISATRSSPPSAVSSFAAPSRRFSLRPARLSQRRAIHRMDLRTTGMEFASEMVVKATLLGLRVTEVPTRLKPDGRSRPPHLRSWRDGWRHLRFLLMYSPRWLFFYPGLLLMSIGLLTGAWLLPEPRHLFGVSLDVHTMLYSAAAVTLGFQAVVFAIFTKVFAITEGLLPEDPRLNKAFQYITLESGILCGAALFLLGLAGSVWAVHLWSVQQFGQLNTSTMLRRVIPSVLSLTLGGQIVFSSFFLSVLGLRRR